MSITSILGHLKTVCPCGLDMLIFFMSITRSLGIEHNHILRVTGDSLAREEVSNSHNTVRHTKFQQYAVSNRQQIHSKFGSNAHALSMSIFIKHRPSYTTPGDMDPGPCPGSRR
ncbi:hypothetical protein V3481_003933 [Fusarium oxysporum f. sp. vasinfectum]